MIKKIEYREAVEFMDAFEFPAIKSLSTNLNFTATVKYGSEKTNPNVSVMGADENYLFTSGYQIEEGRNITTIDVESNTRVVLLGKEVANTLFLTEWNERFGLDLQQTMEMTYDEYSTMKEYLQYITEIIEKKKEELIAEEEAKQKREGAQQHVRTVSTKAAKK